jgi:tetratricopeptide (TPR) repeat protein
MNTDNDRFECERGNWEDVLTYCETGESICSKHPELSAPLLADLDHHYTYVSSYVSKPEVKKLHAQRMVDRHLAQIDRTNTEWLYLGVAYKELSMYYVEAEDFEEAAKAGESSVEAYDNVTFYADKSQMPVLARLAAGWAYLGLSKLDEAEKMILPCVEWIDSSDFQRDFNAFRYSNSNMI